MTPFASARPHRSLFTTPRLGLHAILALVAGISGACHGGGGGGSAPVVDPAASTVVIQPAGDHLANGTDTATVAVTVLDQHGNPMPGLVVELAATGTDNVLVQPATPTDANGETFGFLSSTRAEAKSVTAVVEPAGVDVALAAAANANFVADPSLIDGAVSTAVAAPDTDVVADGAQTSTITVTVLDTFGNPVPGQTVELASTGSNGTLVQPAATTDASGMATGTIASTTAETKTITATINPLGTPVVVAQQPTVAFIADVTTIDSGLSTASASPAIDVVADGSDTSTITVTVFDANGNPVPGQTVQLAATGANNALTQPVAVTDAAGVATGSIASITAETKTVTATINPGPGEVVVTQQPTVGFIADVSTISSTLSTVDATPTMDVVADGASTATITVTVVDANGNPVPGQTVQIAATGSNNTLTQPAGPTDAGGVATGTLATTTAETKTITATVNPGAGEVVLAQQPTVTFVGDPSTISASMSTAVANPVAGVVADGVEVTTVTVTVIDASGNPVPGQTVQLAATGANNALTQPAATTDANGVAVGTLASTTAETKTITVTVNPGAGEVVLLQQPMVTFVADPATIDPALSTATATPDTNVVADDVANSTITVTVRDANGNPVPGQTVQLAATGSNNTLTQPSGPTDANGVATGSLSTTTAETKTVTATVNPGPGQVVLADMPTIDFVGDPTTIDPALSVASAFPDTGVLADGVAQSTITVIVLDANGNAVPGRTVQLAATGTSNTLVQPVATTDANGEATGTIASTAAETKAITVTVDPGPGQVVLASMPTVEFVADASTIDPVLSTAVASPADGLLADGIDASTITVTVRDANGNPVPGQTVQLAATGSNNTLVQPATTTDANGVATGSIASSATETKTITATVNPGPSEVVLAQQPTVSFGGDPTMISAALSTAVASPSLLVAADGVEVSVVTVTVRDAAGVPVSGQTVSLVATGVGNVLTQPAAVTNGAGVATGTLASTAAQAKTLTATINPGPGEVVVAQQPVVTFAWNPTDARFVRTTGTDPGDCSGGTTPATAWRTIGKAASCAPPGTTVYVGAGVYLESVQITQSGSSGSPIRFVADPDGFHTGDAGPVVVDAGGLGSAFQLDGVSWVEVEGFEVTGSGSLGGIRIGDGVCSDVVVRGNRVHGNPDGITVRYAASAAIEHNTVSNNFGPGGTGIEVRASNEVSVRNNLVYNNGGTGIDVLDGSSTLVIESNTLYENAGDQVVVDGSGNVATLRNNVIALGGQNGVTMFVGSTLATDHNLVWGHGGSDWNGTAAGPGDINADPLLVDPDGADDVLGGAGGADDDFHLDAVVPSPAVDAGSADADTIETADGLTMADGTTRTDGKLDGSSPDGATVNLGHHDAVPGDPQPPLGTGNVRLTYGEGTERQPRRRTFDDAGGLWTAEGSAPPTVSTIRWVTERISPLSNGEELVGLLAGTATGGRLDLLRWTGQSWKRELRSIAIASGEVDKRGFDFAFEKLSGDVMIVYSNNTSTPRYRVRTNAGWSAEQALPLNDGGGPFPDVNTGLVQWIEVESRPGSDEVAVAYSDTNRDLVVMTWDGTQWLTATAHVLSTDIWTSDAGGVIRNRPWDIAYESVAGGLVAAWSRSTSVGIWYSRKPAGSASYTTHSKIPSVPNYRPNHVDLAAEPGTSRIAVCGMDIESAVSPERLALATWNGTSWVNGGEYDTAGANLANTGAGDAPCSVGWLGTSGIAVCVYAGDAAGTLDWARWMPGSGWAVQPDVPVPGKDITDSTAIAYNELGHLMAVVSDAAGRLWALRFDGATWTVTNGGTELETGLASTASVPFDAVQQNP